MQCTALSSLESDVRQLNQMTGSGVSNSNQYDVLCKLLKQRREFLDQADQKKKREIIESFLSYAAKGGPQIAWGTMLTRAGYKYYDNPVKSFRGIAQAATVNEVSWGNWMLDTVQKGARNEWSYYKDGKRSVEERPFDVSNPKLVELLNQNR